MPRPLNALTWERLNSSNCGIMSTRGASPLSCRSGVVRMLQGSEAPYFEKKMTHRMLQRIDQLEIPVHFIRTHGHLLDTVVSLTGPNGHTRSVELKVRAYGGPQSLCRLFLSHGWIEFVKENGFQTCEWVLFRLVENSCFHVEKAEFKTSPLSCGLSKCELGNYGREDDDIIPPATTCEANFNPTETPVQPWHGDNMKDVAVIKHPYLGESEYVNYPGLDSAISSNSRFPRFISKLTRISVCGHDIRLELPHRFAKEYGHKFQACVCLRGPSGRWRMVKFRISSTVRTSVRVQFRGGWKDFSQENGFREGDVLLFSLVGFSKFVVQVFPVSSKLK